MDVITDVIWINADKVEEYQTRFTNAIKMRLDQGYNLHTVFPVQNMSNATTHYQLVFIRNNI